MKYLSLLLFVFFTSLSLHSTPPAITSTNVVKADSGKHNSISTRKLFPEDTVKRFIKKYGKDSLINLLNQRIISSENFVLDNILKANTTLSLEELKLMSTYYKLKSENVSIDTNMYKVELYGLYGNKLGDTVAFNCLVDTFVKVKGDFIPIFTQNVSHPLAQMEIILYSNQLIKDTQSLRIVSQELYNYGVPYQLNEKLYTYWKLSELSKRYSGNGSIPKSYQLKLFAELYPDNNPKKYYLDTIPKSSNADSVDPKILYENQPQHMELEHFRNKYNPLRMLAYGLYADDINLKSYSDNLIYLIDAQQKNGSFSYAKKFNYFDSDFTSTFYGLWSLCEFRDKLKKE